MSHQYVNASDVRVQPGALHIAFGVEQARQPGDTEITVQPSANLFITPTVGKQLAIELRYALDRLEANNRIPSHPHPSAIAPQTPGPSRPVSPGTHEHLDRVLNLLRHIGHVAPEIDLEQSFKVVHGHLCDNRLLLGVNRSAAGSRLDSQIITLCQDIGMPGNLLQLFKRSLAEANHVYFGAEQSPDHLMFKAYLEYRDKAEKAAVGVHGAPRPLILFTGLKWDTQYPSRQSVTRYEWFPFIPIATIQERIQRLAHSTASTDMFGIFKAITRQAARRVTDADLQYLEVTEDDNPRKSFDINFYKAGYRLADLQSSLIKAFHQFDISAEQTQRLFARIKGERFGHLAGGLDRENRPFLTVYYGAKRIPGAQLRTASLASQRQS